MTTRATRAAGGTVEAAGVLCWRITPEGVQVLLVRGTKHDEWSWPKGRRHPGETMPQCAVRETAEETGLGVRLGVPLTRLEYTLPDGRDKIVRFWTAQVIGDDDRPRPSPVAVDEIHEAVWVPTARAVDLLPYPEQHLPLADLIELAARDRLRTSAILVLRHAAARSRQSWPAAEADRPLSVKGRQAAAQLPDLLACWHPRQLVSSPWRRCRDTLRPYAAIHGLTPVTSAALSEAGHRADPAAVCDLLDDLLAQAHPALVCTHRPVLPTVLKALRERCDPAADCHLPDADPYLRPAEFLVLQVAHPGRKGPAATGTVVSVEQYRPEPGNPRR